MKNKYFIDPSDNKEYFSGMRAVVSSMGFGFAGSYVYGLLTMSGEIYSEMLWVMGLSLLFIFLLYLLLEKGNIWFDKEPFTRELSCLRKFSGFAILVSAQVIIGTFCSFFADFILSGKNIFYLLSLYVVLFCLVLAYPKVMVRCVKEKVRVSKKKQI